MLWKIATATSLLLVEKVSREPRALVRANGTRPSYRYWASCPDLSYDLARWFPDHPEARQITYRTFRRYVSMSELRNTPFGDDLTYRVSCEDNWGIDFWKSVFPTGEPAYYVTWSGYEFYFAPPSVETVHDQEVFLRRAFDFFYKITCGASPYTEEDILAGKDPEFPKRLK